jgi:hypothetical protein
VRQCVSTSATEVEGTRAHAAEKQFLFSLSEGRFLFSLSGGRFISVLALDGDQVNKDDVVGGVTKKRRRKDNKNYVVGGNTIT